MTTALYNSIGILIALACFFGAASVASAQTIDVVFASDPLFAGTADPLMPGDTITRSFTVTNNSSDIETVYVRTLNDSDTNDLADALAVSITDASGEVYSGQLSDLFARDNKSDSPPLGDLAPSESRAYDMNVTFAPQAGNTYQNGTAAFDLCIGFDGGNENCITGTGTPDDTDGGGGGGGGDNPDNDDDPPPGIIAGESTSTPTFTNTVIDPVVNFVRAAVLGESTTTDTGTSTSVETYEPVVTRTGSAAGVFLSNEYCTLWWLLLLVLISCAWSFYEDRYRNGSAASIALFNRNAIASGVYVIVLFLAELLGFLAGFWWVFAAAWGVMMIVDYRAHQAIPGWTAASRNLFFASAAGLFILTSFLFDFPCTWLPFFFVLVASGLLYFLDRT